MNTINELSIEETNKLREQLGLKKLEVDEKTEEQKSSADKTPNDGRNDIHGGSANNDVKNNETKPMMTTRSKRNEANQEEEKNVMDTTKPKEKMVTRSSKKKLEQTDHVKPISENFTDDINDAESWVKKTRSVMNQKLAPKALYSDEEKETKEEEENGKEKEKKGEKKSSRRGRKKKETGINKLKVEHKCEDIKEEMILTLKDKPVLDETEEPDCLINEELETQNTKNMLHKNEDNYWNKNYYDPLSYYNEDQQNEKENSFKLISIYGDEKQSFEVEVNHEVNKTVEKKGREKKKIEKKEEKTVEQDQVHTAEEIGEEPQNKPLGKKRGRKKSVKINDSQDMAKDIPQDIPQNISQETNNLNETNSFLKIKRRKTQNINKRKKEDRWGFLFGSDGEDKKDSSDKVEKGTANGKKKGSKPMIKGENGNELEKEEPQTVEPEHKRKQVQTGDRKKYKERKKEKSTDVERDNEDVADEIVKALLEDPLDLSFDLGFDRFGDVGEDATEVYTLLEKVAELKKRKKENRQNKNLVNYVVVNEKKKINTTKNGDKIKNTREKDDDDDVNDADNDTDVQKIQNEIIKLTETSEFCKNILLTTDVCASDPEEPNRSTRKRIPGENSKRKKNENDTLKGTSSILKEAINEDVLKNAQIEKKTEEDSNENTRNIESDGGVSKLFNEVQLDQGLFGALTYLKTKGELNMEEKIYRNPESRPLHMPTDKDAIKLDYKSETGKVMTPKETFRHISWIFHGKKQGKNKLEKKIKRMEMERRFKENPIDSLPTLNVLKKYQETKKKLILHFLTKCDSS